jgi:hypothetical protein
MRPTDIACPRCGSKPGESCTSPGLVTDRTDLGYHHASRVDAAVEKLSNRIDALVPVVTTRIARGCTPFCRCDICERERKVAKDDPRNTFASLPPEAWGAVPNRIEMDFNVDHLRATNDTLGVHAAAMETRARDLEQQNASLRSALTESLDRWEDLQRQLIERGRWPWNLTEHESEVSKRRIAELRKLVTP